MPIEHIRSALPTLEELEERMKVKWEKLARKAEEKRKVEEERKRTEEEAAKKVAEEAKAARVVKATVAKKRKAVDDEEVMVGPSKKLREKARAITTDPEPELAESPCQR
jgi:nucleoporin GLE1